MIHSVKVLADNLTAQKLAKLEDVFFKAKQEYNEALAAYIRQEKLRLSLTNLGNHEFEVLFIDGTAVLQDVND